MNANPQTPVKQLFIITCGVFNFLVALVSVPFGLFVGAAGALSVHTYDALIPPLLVGAGGLAGLSGILLLISTSDRRPRRSGIWIVCLSGLTAVCYVVFAYMVELADFQKSEAGTASVIIVPASVTLCLLVEFVLLWHIRAATKPT
jgi:hypothetical protein